MKNINVAVIGAGYWGKKHVDEFSRLPGANLVSVCDLVPENLEMCKKFYGVLKTTDDYGEIIDDKTIDAVSICTNNETHYELAKKALNAGKHVLVEKPLTLDVETSKELIDLARENKKVLCVGHIFRFNNAIRKLADLFKRNFFGKIFYIKLKWTNLQPAIAGRDILMDLAPHTFDIINSVTGQWPVNSTYVGNQFRRDRLEEVAQISSEYADGFMVFTELSWLMPEKRREIFIVGHNRCARIDCLSQSFVVFENNYSYELKIEPNNTLGEELASFINDVRNLNFEQALNSGIVGLKVIESITGCKKINK